MQRSRRVLVLFAGILVVLSSSATLQTRAQTATAAPQQADPTSPELAEADRLTLEVVKLYQAHRYDEALPLAKRSLKLREAALGQKHPLVAESLTNLAELYLSTSRAAEAEPLLKRALAIYEINPDTNGLIVGKTLDRLAAFRAASSDLKKAEELFRRAIAIKEKAAGPNHAEVAFSKDSLADFYTVQKDYPRAITLLQEVIAIKEQGYGQSHVEVGRSLERLACALYKNNQKPDAEKVEARANQILYADAATKPEPPFLSAGTFECKAIVNPRPAFPEAAKGRREGRFTIMTAVTVDESGNVISAKFVSGDPAFRKNAEEAALKAKFRPLVVAGHPAKFRGLVTHTFEVMSMLMTVPGVRP